MPDYGCEIIFLGVAIIVAANILYWGLDAVAGAIKDYLDD